MRDHNEHSMPSPQGRYFLLTIPKDDFSCAGGYELPSGVVYIKGQLEVGETTGYEHWQVLVILNKKKSCSHVQGMYGGRCHVELSRSSAADEYVWKEHTAVVGTKFEFGTKPIRRNSQLDWERIWDLAKQGNIEECPASIRVQHYRTLRSIASDFAQPLAVERSCFVFWGRTGTGKSRRAWSEAGMGAFPKDPRTKFWCGYRGQEHVVLDEFRGGIDISHLLRWLDRYPVIVEVKGGSCVLSAKQIYITSNISPESWYPLIDDATLQALLRRLTIVEFE